MEQFFQNYRIGLAAELENDLAFDLEILSEDKKANVTVNEKEEKNANLEQEQTNKKSQTEEEKKESKININTASLEELQKVPGIGPVIAQRILDYRKEVGRFLSLDELREVKGIGEKTFEKLKPYLTI
ncbi:MAG TPA: helix-hairpin-helix domain-containing protein [Firmicutes bacterium]|nr:helix-hairpin-helix domain-containing protein [Bacillota bacterium]